MAEIEFNLVDEPWIRVMKNNCSVQECSLLRVLLDSRNYQSLAGELPTQDVAILRLLLAILHTVFYRVNLDGEDDPIEDEDQALERWQMLWEMGHFPENPIREYLKCWRERFWLFHPEHPFYQVSAVEKSSSFPASKLNGEISESNNKLRLFSSRAASYKDGLGFAEAARWLVTLLGFDDAASTKVEIGAGAGWLGQHANVYAVGDNLFETLMLNLVFLRDGDTVWGENVPVWETPVPRAAKKREIPIPDNQAAILTLQSRRVKLIKGDNSNVTGYCATGGDYFGKDRVNKVHCEQMMQWGKKEEGKKKTITLQQYVPQKANADKLMWQDFEATVACSGEYIFGIAAWIRRLYRENIITNRIIHFSSVGVIYDKSGGSITDVVSDYLDFHVSLLKEAGKLWDKLIQDKIALTEKTGKLLGKLAEALFKAAGGKPGSNAQKARGLLASQTYYAAVDIPFRKWLASIDPELGDEEALRAEKDREWRNKALWLAKNQAEEMIEQAGNAAFKGRWVSEGKKEAFYSSSTAYNCFLRDVKNVFTSRTD